MCVPRWVKGGQEARGLEREAGRGAKKCNGRSVMLTKLNRCDIKNVLCQLLVYGVTATSHSIPIRRLDVVLNGCDGAQAANKIIYLSDGCFVSFRSS